MIWLGSRRTCSGNRFDSAADCVITGSRVMHASLRNVRPDMSVGADIWIKLGEITAELRRQDSTTTQAWNERCRTRGIGTFVLPKGRGIGYELAHHLARVDEIHRVATYLDGSLREFTELARCLFPDAEPNEGNRALHGLIATAVFARTGDSNIPLLPARYHLAASGIQGGVARLSANDPEGWSDLRLKRSHEDPHDIPYFRILACRNCGEPYFEGWRTANVIGGKRRPGAQRCIFRIRALARAAAVEIGAEVEEESPGARTVEWVDAETGRLTSSESGGSVAIVPSSLEEDDEEKQLYLRTCSACGSRQNRYPEPISPLHPGDEAISAVAAQVLLEALPEEEPDEFPRPLAGRKSARVLRQSSGCSVLCAFLRADKP